MIPIGIVLSGGGSKGDFEVGALQFLYSKKFYPDIICGTSVGSINAIKLAEREGDVSLSGLVDIWLGLKRNSDMWGEEPWFSTIDPSIKRSLVGILMSSGAGGKIKIELGGEIYAGIALLPGFITAIIVKEKVDEINALLNALQSEKAIYNLDPVKAKLKDPKNLNLDKVRSSGKLRLVTANLESGELQCVMGSGGLIGGYEQLGPEDFIGKPSVVSWPPTKVDQVVFGEHMVTWGPTNIHVFVRGTDNRIYHKAWDGAGWSGYQQLGLKVISSDPFAVSWGPNRLDVFARDTDNRLYHNASLDGGATWQEDTLGPEDFSGNPSVVSWGPNRIDVFVRRTDNKLYHKSWDGTVWSGYQPLGTWEEGREDRDHVPLPDRFISELFSSDPFAVSWGPNRLDVFARDTDNRLYHLASLDGGATWQEDTLGPEDFSGNPSVVSWGPNRIDVFVRRTDNKIYHKAWDGSGWSGYQEPSMEVFSGDPFAVSCGTNQIDVFARGMDNRLYTKSWNSSRPWEVPLTSWSWSSYEQLGPEEFPSDPSVVSCYPNRIDVFVRGTDNRLNHKVMYISISLIDAVIASSSIPVTFPPIKLGLGNYIDGGIRDILPIDYAINLGADKIFAIAAGKITIDQTDSFDGKNILDIAARSVFDIMLGGNLQAETNPTYGWGSGKEVIIIAPTLDVHDILTVDPGLIRICMAYGFMRASDVVNFQKKDLVKFQRLSDVLDQIIESRKYIWQKESIANGTRMDAPDNPPDTNALLLVRQGKRDLATLVTQRLALGGDMPPDFTSSWWTNWEGHNWESLIDTPWDEFTVAYPTGTDENGQPTGTTTITIPAEVPPTIGWHHFYTTDAAERDNAITNIGYSDEGIACYVSSTQVAGTIPLYRLYHPTVFDHFYTTDAAERDNAITNIGYSDEGIACYVSSTQVAGTIPLYRTFI